jgi:nitroreductase
VATRGEPEEHARLLSCLIEPNRVWAQRAPVLALGVAALRFRRNGHPNRAAHHDLGLATANLWLEALARGLALHPMIGILPDRARELYAIPEDAEALTGLALGYAGGADALPEALRAREQAPRARRPLAEFVFAGTWARPARLA